MKRIEIPIIERKDTDTFDTTSNNNSIVKIYEENNIDLIFDKYLSGQLLTRKDLIVLYNIYNKKPLYDSEKNVDDYIKKANEIMKKRNYLEDLAMIFDCGIDEITSNKDELDEYPDKFVILLDSYGGRYKCCVLEHIYSKLKYINGDVYLNLASNYNNNFPSLEVIGGDAYLSFENADGFENLKSFCKCIDWNNLRDASGLRNLEIIGGNAKFQSLQSAEGLENLKYINGSAFFDSLISSKGLEDLRKIGYLARFLSLRDIDYFNSLEQVSDEYWIMDYILKEELKTKVLKRR